MLGDPTPALALRSPSDDRARPAMIKLNGQASDVPAGETVAGALGRLGVSRQLRGVAVAVDGEVVPRGEWESFVLAEDARMEVLTAMQGG